MLGEVAALVEIGMARDPELRAQLRRAWNDLRARARGRPSGRVRELEAEAERARARIRRATDLFMDEQIGKAEYDDKCARERAVLDAARAELERLRGSARTLPAPSARWRTSWPRPRGLTRAVQVMDVARSAGCWRCSWRPSCPSASPESVYAPEIVWTAEGSAPGPARRAVADAVDQRRAAPVTAVRGRTRGTPAADDYAGAARVSVTAPARLVHPTGPVRRATRIIRVAYLEVTRVPYAEVGMGAEGEEDDLLPPPGASAPVRARVVAARERQQQRFADSAISSNARIGPGAVRRFARTDAAGSS